jgi:hypothetical protein
MMRKGQISIEFVASMLFFIIVLTGIIFVAVDYVPMIEDSNAQASVNMEARRVTSMLMTSPGRHSFAGGGTDWEESELKRDSVESIGLASDYHVVEKDKVMALSTVGDSKFNYSQFRQATDLENQYRFEFTAMPIVDTSDQFTRTNPPSEPQIIEPVNNEYFNSGNLVGFGSIRMGGTQYNVLTTSHNGEYDTMYMVSDASSGWNFSEAERYGVGERIDLGGRTFEVRGFQNRGEKTGTLVVFSRDLKTFGSAFDVSATIVKLNRYAVLKQPGAGLHPLKIEVFSWN